MLTTPRNQGCHIRSDFVDLPLNILRSSKKRTISEYTAATSPQILESNEQGELRQVMGSIDPVALGGQMLATFKKLIVKSRTIHYET